MPLADIESWLQVGYSLSAGAFIQLSGLIGAAGPPDGMVPFVNSDGSFSPEAAWSLQYGKMTLKTQKSLIVGTVSFVEERRKYPIIE